MEILDAPSAQPVAEDFVCRRLPVVLRDAGLRGKQICSGCSIERFAAGDLGYGYRPGTSPLGANSWGKPVYVAAAVDAQNAAIRELSRVHPNVLFVDEQELMPKQARLFMDCCHLTEAGCVQFIENLWPTVTRSVAEWRAGRAATASP